MNLIKNDEEEFKNFRDLAIEDAMTVDSLSDVISMCGGGFRRKRKLNNENCRVEKLSKQEEVAAIFQSEIRSEDGLEMETMTRMRARKEISLCNLKLSPTLLKECPLNSLRVTKLARSMREIFDPSQMVLTVIPITEDNNESEYYVVAGQHRFRAIQQLDQDGCLTQLPTLNEKKVLCIVINSQSPTVHCISRKEVGRFNLMFQIQMFTI